MPTLDDVRTAATRIEGVAHRTRVLTSRRLDERTGATVALKCEQEQRTGSFKIRGATNAVAALDPAVRARGVIAHSSGNHAQALALAARLHGVPAVIVMPTDAPASKVAATRGYGAEVVTYDRYAEDREAVAAAVAAERGLVLVPPYDDEAVIAGQGTVGLELCADAGPLDALLVCVGGGGLAAGCATAATALCPGVRVVGVEPAAGDDVARSLAAGRRITITTPPTIADGQQTTAPGALTFPILQRLLDGVVTVTDTEIVAAMRYAARELKVVLEPSGACALAALLAEKVEGLRGRRVGVTLSGGNVDLDRYATLLRDGAPSATP